MFCCYIRSWQLKKPLFADPLVGKLPWLSLYKERPCKVAAQTPRECVTNLIKVNNAKAWEFLMWELVKPTIGESRPTRILESSYIQCTLPSQSVLHVHYHCGLPLSLLEVPVSSHHWQGPSRPACPCVRCS